MFYVEGKKKWWRQTFLHQGLLHDFENFWVLKVLSHFMHPPSGRGLFRSSSLPAVTPADSEGFYRGTEKGRRHVRNRAWIHLGSTFTIIRTCVPKSICKTSRVLVGLLERRILVTFYLLSAQKEDENRICGSMIQRSRNRLCLNMREIFWGSHCLTRSFQRLQVCVCGSSLPPLARWWQQM